MMLTKVKKRYLSLEDIFGFCKYFENLTKSLGLHLMLKTTNLQDINYTSMADDIKVFFNSLCLYIPNLNPSVKTHLLFNEATQNYYKISSGEWYTERRLRSDLLVQHVIGSGQQVNSPK